jgi:hypothetical protein
VAVGWTPDWQVDDVRRERDDALADLEDARAELEHYKRLAQGQQAQQAQAQRQVQAAAAQAEAAVPKPWSGIDDERQVQLIRQAAERNDWLSAHNLRRDALERQPQPPPPGSVAALAEEGNRALMERQAAAAAAAPQPAPAPAPTQTGPSLAEQITAAEQGGNWAEAERLKNVVWAQRRREGVTNPLDLPVS